jgi:hypothetical protein
LLLATVTPYRPVHSLNMSENALKLIQLEFSSRLVKRQYIAVATISSAAASVFISANKSDLTLSALYSSCKCMRFILTVCNANTLDFNKQVLSQMLKNMQMYYSVDEANTDNVASGYKKFSCKYL